MTTEEQIDSRIVRARLFVNLINSEFDLGGFDTEVKRSEESLWIDILAHAPDSLFENLFDLRQQQRIVAYVKSVIARRGLDTSSS